MLYKMVDKSEHSDMDRYDEFIDEDFLLFLKELIQKLNALLHLCIRLLKVSPQFYISLNQFLHRKKYEQGHLSIFHYTHRRSYNESS